MGLAADQVLYHIRVVKKEFGNMDALQKGIYSKNKYDLSECLCAVEMNLYLVRFSWQVSNKLVLNVWKDRFPKQAI